MSRISNFELERNLQAKTYELGNFLIDTTENLSFTSSSNGGGSFVQANMIQSIPYSYEYYSYPNYYINQSSEYPMINTSMLYYPTTSTAVEHPKYEKNYTNLNNKMISDPKLGSLSNNYTLSQTDSICNQHEIYGNKSINHNYHQEIQNSTTKSNLSIPNSNSAMLTAQVPRMVKEFSKNYHYQIKKHFQNDKKSMKFNKYNVVRDTQRDLSPIVVSLEKLRNGPNYPNPSELFTIITLFRQLSHYTMQMCKERRSLETLFVCNVTGYTPDSNYLPAIIKDISNHIKLTKQSIAHEFYEIQKLIDSIKICQYGNINELNNKFQFEIINLEKYEYIHIKHKNGMLLLSNDKIVGLKNILTNIIEYVRWYTVYVTTLNYKLSKERNIVLTSTNIREYKSNGRQEIRRIGV